MEPARDPAATQSPAGALTVLGFETSCDDTAAAVVRRDADGAVRVLGERVVRQDAAHAPFGGVVPEIAARAHVDRLDAVARRAMADAGVGFGDLDAVAATAGPGLVGGVMVGLMTAKAVALAHRLPLVAVNHLEGHALSPCLSEKVAFPYLLLLVSGGHTQILMVRGVGDYQRLGTTVDDAAGEAFDKIAKLTGLGLSGAAVECAATAGDATRFALPRPFRGAPNPDFSFAGLKTAATRAYQSLDSPSDADKADLAASFQAAVADVLADRVRTALALPAAAEASAVIVAGGVAANAVIRAALTAAAEDAGRPLVAPPLKWCTDNAAMIALVGIERLRRGESDQLDVAARPRWPLDPAAAPALGGGKKGPKA